MIRTKIEEILSRGHEFMESDAKELCQICGEFEVDHEIPKVSRILSLIQQEIGECLPEKMKYDKDTVLNYSDVDRVDGHNGCLSDIRSKLAKKGLL